MIDGIIKGLQGIEEGYKGAMFPNGTDDKTMHATTSAGLNVVMRDMLGMDMPTSMLTLLGLSIAKELMDTKKKGGKFDPEDIIANFMGAFGAEAIRGGVNEISKGKKNLIRMASKGDQNGRELHNTIL